VRQALNYAIDREALNKTFFGGKGGTTSQFIAANIPGNDPSLDNRYPFDLAKAKQLMADAGYAQGFTLPVLSTKVINLSTIMQAVADSWSRIGVKVEQTVKQPADWQADFTSTKFPAMVLPLTGIPAYSSMRTWFGPDAALNPFKTTDPEFSQDMSKAASVDVNSGGSTEALVAANARLLDQAWYVGLMTTSVFYHYNPKKVTGLEMPIGESTPHFYDWKLGGA